MTRVEDQFPDVLENIEFGIVTIYRHHPEMSNLKKRLAELQVRKTELEETMRK